MAQKTKPTAIRLGITKPWISRWFFRRSLNYFLTEDKMIRKTISEKILHAGIDKVEIQRMADEVKVIVRAARPGIIIGRGGKGVEELKRALVAAIKKLRRANKIPEKLSFNLTIDELKRTEVSAQVLSQQVAYDIERRLPFRLVLRRHLDGLKQNREIKGARITVAGRLNGAEISRRESMAFGSMPSQTLRADIDYGEATAFNTYGTTGVKVWLHKGEIFDV